MLLALDEMTKPQTRGMMFVIILSKTCTSVAEVVENWEQPREKRTSQSKLKTLLLLLLPNIPHHSFLSCGISEINEQSTRRGEIQ